MWVNNVGQGVTRVPSQLTDDDIDDMMRLNVRSALIDEGLLMADEERELDDLVACVDMLNILKARALYTLQSLEKAD